MAQQAPADIEHDFAIHGKKPSPAQKEAREKMLASKGTVGKPAQRRTVGLLKMIRNMAFAHRCVSQYARDLHVITSVLTLFLC